MKSCGSLFIAFSIFLSASCQEPSPQLPEKPEQQPEPIEMSPTNLDSATYLALGDSYTIGESVPQPERWPLQLADSLQLAGIAAEVTIIAKTGWTTAELQTGIEQAEITGETYDMVSLLIGVNNQFRGQSLSTYKIEFQELLEASIAFAGGRADKVFVLSIPDYGVTPFAANRNPEQIAIEIDSFNTAHRVICDEFSVQWFDITAISRDATSVPELIAEDNLHPSGEMYRRWVQSIMAPVAELIKKP